MGEYVITEYTEGYALIKLKGEPVAKGSIYKVASRLLSLKDRLHTLGFRLYTLQVKGREEIRIACSGYPVELLFFSVSAVLYLESLNSRKLCDILLKLMQEAHRGSYQGMTLEANSIAV